MRTLLGSDRGLKVTLQGADVTERDRATPMSARSVPVPRIPAMPSAVVSPTRPVRATLVVLFGLLVAFFGTPAPHVAADSGMESQFVQLINRERAAAGRPALKVVSDLTSVARKHSVRMANEDRLHHNTNLASDVKNWKRVAENVGVGPSVQHIHDGFMASSGHRNNLLDSDWVEVGVGVEVRGRKVWVTEIFRLPSGATSTPPPAPKPSPSPSPTATPKPSPTATPKPSPSPQPAPATAPKPSPTPVPAAQAVAAPQPPAIPEPPQPEPLPQLEPEVDRTLVVLTRLVAADSQLDDLTD